MSSLLACVSVIITLSILLALLGVSKFLFIRNRRNNCYPSFPRSSLSLADSFSAGSSHLHSSLSRSLEQTSSKSFFPSSSRKLSMAGFWVGFFGSPTSETNIHARIDKTTRKRTKQSSFLSLSSRRWFPPSQNGSVRTGASLSNSPSGNPSSDNSDSTSHQNSDSLRLPTYPNQVLQPQSRSHRRLSLPSIGQSDLAAPNTQRRHSSLKSVRGMKDQLAQTSSVRLVNPDSLLPTSFLSQMPISYYQATFQSKLVPKPPSPLQSLTESTSPQSSLAGTRISHPFALMPSSAFKRSSGPDKLPVPKPLPSELIQDRVGDAGDSALRQPLSPLPPQPLMTLPARDSPELVDIPAPRPLSLIDVPDSPPLGSAASVSPPLFSVPAFPGALSVKKKIQLQSGKRVHSRRSPPIGPSPLRRMILPNSSSGSVNEANKENEPERDAVRVHPPARFRTSLPAVLEASPSPLDSESGNTLLGMIRELVQATSEWDTSIVLQDSFKNMVESAATDPSVAGGDKLGRDYALEGARGDSARSLNGASWESDAAWKRDNIGIAW